MSESTTMRCTVCRAEFTEEQAKGATACPACGSLSVPMSIAHDTTIRINWHEVRILTMWADNWAHKHCEAQQQRALASIVRELEKQRPEGCAALTLAGEVRELQREHPGASLVGAGGEVIVPPKGKPS